jgi:hypothetical protein
MVPRRKAGSEDNVKRCDGNGDMSMSCARTAKQQSSEGISQCVGDFSLLRVLTHVAANSLMRMRVNALHSALSFPNASPFSSNCTPPRQMRSTDLTLLQKQQKSSPAQSSRRAYLHRHTLAVSVACSTQQLPIGCRLLSHYSMVTLRQSSRPRIRSFCAFLINAGTQV